MSDNIFMELSTHLNLQAHGVQMNTNFLPNHVQHLFLSRLMPGEIWPTQRPTEKKCFGTRQ